MRRLRAVSQTAPGRLRASRPAVLRPRREVLSLNWRARRQVTPAVPTAQEAWPGAECGCQSPHESRSGAPEGERAPKADAPRKRRGLRRAPPRTRTSGFALSACLHGGHGWMRLSALRSPLLSWRERFVFCTGLVVANLGRVSRREHTVVHHCERSEAIQFRAAALDCFVAGAPRNDEHDRRREGYFASSLRAAAKQSSSSRRAGLLRR
jgi:hypothetical protein